MDPLPWPTAPTAPLGERTRHAMAVRDSLPDGTIETDRRSDTLEDRIARVARNAERDFFAIPRDLVRPFATFNEKRGPWVNLSTHKDLRPLRSTMARYDFPSTALFEHRGQDWRVPASLLGFRFGLEKGLRYETMLPEIIGGYLLARTIAPHARVEKDSTRLLAEFPYGVSVTLRGIKDAPGEFNADVTMPSRSRSSSSPQVHASTFSLETLGLATHPLGIFDIKTSGYPQYGSINGIVFDYAQRRIHRFSSKLPPGREHPDLFEYHKRRRQFHGGHALALYIIESLVRKHYGLSLNTPLPIVPQRWESLATDVAQKAYLVDARGACDKPGKKDVARIVTMLLGAGYEKNRVDTA